MPGCIPELGVLGVRLKFLAQLRQNRKWPGPETGRRSLSQMKFEIWAKTDVKCWSKTGADVWNFRPSGDQTGSGRGLKFRWLIARGDLRNVCGIKKSKSMYNYNNYRNFEKWIFAISQFRNHVYKANIKYYFEFESAAMIVLALNTVALFEKLGFPHNLFSKIEWMFNALYL